MCVSIEMRYGCIDIVIFIGHINASNRIENGNKLRTTSRSMSGRTAGFGQQTCRAFRGTYSRTYWLSRFLDGRQFRNETQGHRQAFELEMRAQEELRLVVAGVAFHFFHDDFGRGKRASRLGFLR